MGPSSDQERSRSPREPSIGDSPPTVAPSQNWICSNEPSRDDQSSCLRCCTTFSPPQRLRTRPFYGEMAAQAARIYLAPVMRRCEVFSVVTRHSLVYTLRTPSLKYDAKVFERSAPSTISCSTYASRFGASLTNCCLSKRCGGGEPVASRVPRPPLAPALRKTTAHLCFSFLMTLLKAIGDASSIQTWTYSQR
jgi:hypothetical protein